MLGVLSSSSPLPANEISGVRSHGSNGPQIRHNCFRINRPRIHRPPTWTSPYRLVLISLVILLLMSARIPPDLLPLISILHGDTEGRMFHLPHHPPSSLVSATPSRFT